MCGAPAGRADKEDFVPITPITINTNIVNQGSNGYDVPGDDYTVTVDAGFAVGSDGFGFFTNKLDTILVNHGYVLGLEKGSQGWGVLYGDLALSMIDLEQNGSAPPDPVRSPGRRSSRRVPRSGAVPNPRQNASIFRTNPQAISGLARS